MRFNLPMTANQWGGDKLGDGPKRRPLPTSFIKKFPFQKKLKQKVKVVKVKKSLKRLIYKGFT